MLPQLKNKGYVRLSSDKSPQVNLPSAPLIVYMYVAISQVLSPNLEIFIAPLIESTMLCAFFEQTALCQLLHCCQTDCEQLLPLANMFLYTVTRLCDCLFVVLLSLFAFIMMERRKKNALIDV